MKHATFALFAAATLASSLTSSARAQQFTDGAFLDSQWSITKVIDTTPAGDALYSGVRGSGGNPGDCRQIAHNWQIVSSGVSILMAHMKTGVEYNPASLGTLKSISLVLDIRCDSAPQVNAIAFGLVLSQGGKWFTAPGATAGVGQPWFHFNTTATANDWVQVGGSAKPDFSKAGALMKFGFFSANGGSGVNTRVTATGRVDNFLARFNRSCPADLNGDGFVDDSDFPLFAVAYNLLDCADPAMPSGCPADLNNDAIVDDSDFSIFALAYDALLCP